MPRLATLKASLDFLLLGRLEWLLWLLHLVLLDCLTKALVSSTKGLMNYHFTKLLIALSVLLPTLHQLGIIYLELLILLQKVSLKHRYIITTRRARHVKQILARGRGINLCNIRYTIIRRW